MVSIRVSPFAVELWEATKFIESAPKRFWAVSNEIRVLVEFSKNALMTLLPSKFEDFLTGLEFNILNSFARSMKYKISSLLKFLVPKRSFFV